MQRGTSWGTKINQPKATYTLQYTAQIDQIYLSELEILKMNVGR